MGEDCQRSDSLGSDLMHCPVVYPGMLQSCATGTQLMVHVPPPLFPAQTLQAVLVVFGLAIGGAQYNSEEHME